MGQVLVRANGQRLVLTQARNAAGATVGVWSNAALTAAVSLPYSFTGDQTLYMRDGVTRIVVTTPAGTVLKDADAFVGSEPVVVTPQPTLEGVAAELPNAYAPLVLADQVVIPPATASFVGSGESVWFTANYGVGSRFMLSHKFTPERVNMACTVASGNIEVGIYSVTRVGNQSFNLVKVASSGIIACPTPGTNGMPGNCMTVPLASPPTLSPGQYVLAFWADNTTIAVAHVLVNGLLRNGLAMNVMGSATPGGLLNVASNMQYSGRTAVMTLEGSIPLG